MREKKNQRFNIDSHPLQQGDGGTKHNAATPAPTPDGTSKVVHLGGHLNPVTNLGRNEVLVKDLLCRLVHSSVSLGVSILVAVEQVCLLRCFAHLLELMPAEALAQ